ncbi:MAG TPA: transcriptional repressor [Anaerolineae bacterium]|nr:transcriptional repressor [Anaerolineae bacterium]
MSEVKISGPYSVTDFANTIRSRGRRLTPQRQVILDAVRKVSGHSTPDEIYTRVHAKNPAISRATIYRTLDFLCELRLVVAMQWGGQMYYEAAGRQPHHHLVCRNCGSIELLDHMLLKTMFKTIDKKYEFCVDMDHVALFGLCADCRKK